MVWEMLLYIYILYSPDWHYRSTMPTFLFLYGAAFAVVHSFVHFGIGFKGHAMWHVFMGFNSYSANTFLMFCRAEQRGWAPKIVHVMGLLPYVKIEKPKSQ
ncbi:alkaline ceramidase [Morus notabilis]|uniref:alkaline ceramidase n=1 Tax=Morus notabilis TaxID=981085 RepID=UPI000CED2274|nr:alkaline ceramidase [Morus notabilis]